VGDFSSQKRLMTKTKSQKARAKAAKTAGSGGQGRRSHWTADPPPARRGKKWEFNLVKTGNNSLSYGSGNSVRARNMPEDIAVVSRPRSSPGIMEVPLVQDEFVALIDGSSSFTSRAFPIQPGMGATFPFGSKVASLYERYQVRDLAFYFKPTVSGFAVGGQAGKVLLSVDYDALSAAPSSIQEVESMDPHIDGMPYQSIELRLDPQRCTPKGGKFTRQTMVPGGDLKTYDAGTLFVSVAGNLTAANIGELRVRYTLSLMNPRLTAVKIAPCNCISVFRAPGDTPFPAALSNMLGFVQAPENYNPLGILVNVVGGGFTIPAGTYRVSLNTSFYAPVGCRIVTFNVVINRDNVQYWKTAFALGTTSVAEILPLHLDFVLVAGEGCQLALQCSGSTSPSANILTYGAFDWSFQLV